MAPRPRTLLHVQPLEDRTNPYNIGDIDPAKYFPDSVLFSVAPGNDQAAVIDYLKQTGVATAARPLGFGVYKLQLRPGVSVVTAVSGLAGNPRLGFIEPNYRLQKDVEPSDPMFQNGDLWGQKNTGQSGGTAGADIAAPAGWDIGRGTGQTVVAVADDGMDFTHPDLAGNLWRNPGETAGDGIDNDGNGYIDDVNGWDTADSDNNPIPDGTDTHGTHVAGTVGAVGNNGIGVSGVAWKTRIMPIKIFGATGGMGAAVEAFAYAANNGARVMNNSWTFIDIPRPAALEAAVAGANAKGLVVVCSGGNQDRDNDAHDRWPSNFAPTYNNMIVVAATDRNDQKAGFSNYGRTFVTLAAPGVDVMSTVRGGQYDLLSGTSMASPHVAGAATVFLDAFPDSTAQEVVEAMKASARPVSSQTGLSITGGVLNLPGLMAQGSRALFATGAGEGGGPHVKVYRANGTPVTGFMAYHPSFTGGVRVGTGDVTGDRQSDIVTVPGPGGGPHVKVFDGSTFQEVYSFMAFEPTFRGGLTVSTGDVNGDGRADIIIGAEAGGGPRVAVFSRLTPTGGLTRIADFFAYDPKFTGGVRVAAGVFTAGSKMADVLTAPGAGGGPHLKRFSAATISNANPTVAAQTMVGDANDRSGLWIASGDLTGDGVADVAAGVGSGAATVNVLDGRSLAPIHTLRNPTSGELPGLTNPNSSTQVGSTTPPPTNNGLLAPGSTPNALPFTGNPAAPTGGNKFGVRVAVQDVTGDKLPDLILAGGPLDSPIVSLLDGRTYTPLNSYLAYDPLFFGGVYVGGVGA